MAPGPHLLAGGDVVVGDGGNALLQPAVIARDEVHVALPLGDQEGGGHLHGIVAGEVGALAVVKGTRGVVHALGDGPGQHRPTVVVVDPLHIRREDGAVVLVHRNGQIGPPHEQLGLGGAVVHPHLGPDVAPARFDGHAHHALHAIEGIHLAGPHGSGAVAVLLKRGLQGKEGGGTMVLRPVELDAAGDPCARQAHQSGLDHLVAIDEIVLAHLVPAAEDLSAQRGQHLGCDVLVFQLVDFVFHIPLFIGDAIGIGQGIEPPAGALIGLLFKEHGQLVGFFGYVGWNDLLDATCLNFFHDCRSSTVIALSALVSL